jgi:hypothetical protein
MINELTGYSKFLLLQNHRVGRQIERCGSGRVGLLRLAKAPKIPLRAFLYSLGFAVVQFEYVTRRRMSIAYIELVNTIS